MLVTYVLAGVFLVTTALHVWLLTRMMPYRKDLLEGTKGWQRFLSFINQSARANYSAQSYQPGGERYLPWLRWSGLLAGMTLCGTVLSLV
jgi:hypothetical protein